MDNHELAAAIRRGAAITGWEKSGPYCNYITGATCVYGAAAVGLGAIGARAINELAGKIHAEFDEHEFTRLHNISIIRANDSGVTREQIADWLDTLDVAKPADRQESERFMHATLEPVEVAL